MKEETKERIANVVIATIMLIETIVVVWLTVIQQYALTFFTVV